MLIDEYFLIRGELKRYSSKTFKFNPTTIEVNDLGVKKDEKYIKLREEYFSKFYLVGTKFIDDDNAKYYDQYILEHLWELLRDTNIRQLCIGHKMRGRFYYFGYDLKVGDNINIQNRNFNTWNRGTITKIIKPDDFISDGNSKYVINKNMDMVEICLDHPSGFYYVLNTFQVHRIK